MLPEIIKQFNWVDVFIIIILFRIIYVAVKNGLSKEIFKFFGTVTAIYLSLHYYTALSDFIHSRIPESKGPKIPLEFLDFLYFLLLAIFGYLLFVLLRSIFHRFIKMEEAVPNFNRWSGFVLGLFRSILLAGLIVFTLVVSHIGYFKKSVQNSYLGSRFFQVAPATYAWLWNGITSKFTEKEEYNPTVKETQQDFQEE